MRGHCVIVKKIENNCRAYDNSAPRLLDHLKHLLCKGQTPKTNVATLKANNRYRAPPNENERTENCKKFNVKCKRAIYKFVKGLLQNSGDIDEDEHIYFEVSRRFSCLEEFSRFAFH